MRTLGSLIPMLLVATALTAHAGSIAVPPGGTVVLACSGCPQDPSGPSLLGVSIRSGAVTTLVGPCTRPSRRLCPAPYWPAFSRTGKKLAVIDGNTAVATADMRGKGYRVLVATRGVSAGSQRSFSGVSWSSDTSRLVTAALDGTFKSGVPRTSIFMVDSRSGAMRRIRASTRSSGGFVNPAWSPDGQLIATGSTRGRLFAMRQDGSGLRRLGPVGASGWFPTWSPDGRRVAALDLNGTVWWTGRTGRARHVLVTDPDLDSSAGLAWSPDGRWLAYARATRFGDSPEDGIGHVLILVAADGSGMRERVLPILPTTAGELYGLAWGRG